MSTPRPPRIPSTVVTGLQASLTSAQSDLAAAEADITAAERALASARARRAQAARDRDRLVDIMSMTTAVNAPTEAPPAPAP